MARVHGWVFIPDMRATSDEPDYDYLNYGFWLKKTADADGAVTYNEVETFAGSTATASNDVTAVTGSATYNGGATGVYVHKELNSDGSRAYTTAGQFSAAATLTATFGQVNNDSEPTLGTIADNLLNTLTGTINNFALEHGEENDWSVALTGDINPAKGEVTGGKAKGGGDEGTFNATFYGDVMGVDHDMDPDTDDIFPKPGSVVGEFDANFSDGSAAGAFGARKE